jgi:autotransporter translocation and assembly factor TamB
VNEGTPATPAQPAVPRPRRWGRRIRRGLLALLLLLLIFHRPILIGIVHAVAIKVAAGQNIRLSLAVEGTIFTNISLKNIRATPNGNGPTPVEDISIEEVTVHYSIPSLIRHGISEFLQSYSLRNATIAVKPVEGTPEQKSDLASTLHGLIQQPALFSDRVDIENLSLIAHVPDGDFAVKGLTLTLDPTQPGVLEIPLLQVPKIRTWHDLKATTSYADRDMILRGLELDPQILVRKFELDASQRAKGINRLDVQGMLFGGSADFSLLVKELPGKHANQANNAVAQVDSTIRDLSLTKVSQYFNVSTPAVGSITEAAIHLTGDPNTPSGWTGSLTTDAGTIHAGGAVLDKANVRLDVSNGWATFGSTVFSGSNSVTLQADGKLPTTLDGFAGTAITGWLNITANDLRHIAVQIASGKVDGNGTFDLRNNTLHANLDLKAADISGSNDVELSAGELKAEVIKALPRQSGTNTPPFAGLQTWVELHAADLRAGAYAIDSADVQAQTDNGHVNVKNIAVRRAQDALTASGACDLPGNLADVREAPANVQFSFHAPSLAAFNAEPNLKGPDGSVEADGTFTNGPGGYAGGIAANVTDVRMQDFSAQGLNLKVSIARNIATIDSLTFALNPTDGFSAIGHVGLQPPYAYVGALQSHIRDLSKFNALVANLKGGLAGALNLDWKGKGDLQTLASSGQLQFSLSNGKVQNIAAINASINGNYSPAGVDFPIFWVTCDKGGVSAIIDAKQDVLRVNQLVVKQAARPLVTGSVAIPLDLRTPAEVDTLIPETGPLAADLVTSDIEIASFFPKGKAPASGTGKVTITARGSVRQPNVHVVVTGRNLKANAAAELAPAALDADFTLLGSQLSLKARLAQASVSPVEIAGTVPLPLAAILHDHKVNMQSPVQLSVRVPRSSLGVITRLAPAVRFVQGTAEVSVDVAGTIAKPVLSGAAVVDMPAMRLSNPDMPSLSGFRANLAFSGDRLAFRQFEGNLSGGHFTMTGGLGFKTLTNPDIDLHFLSKGDLLLRNESVTVRADSNIHIAGPLAAASVTGDIGITKSRFFKEIEILPLELPGRPAPKPPPAPPTNPSITTPPLRDWKFALKIHTEDPFIIQGNLANGSALIDMNVGGTGAAPTLEGTVRIENFVASLPFSKLHITNGYVYFSKDDPFVPHLNIQAVSNMQDYEINVFIYGTAQNPKTVMSSEPPLRQEDIVSLLATGATTANLSNGNALAGRAAILLLQQVYHKFFKAKPSSMDNESFTSRFKVDVGGVDPRTGQQSISSSFKLTQDFYLIGDLDVGGDIRGMIRYLLRFK